MESEPRSRMLRPEELVEVHSRELNIDLENEQFEEVNVQLSSSDDEDQKTPNKQSEAASKVVQRSVNLQARSVPQQTTAQPPKQTPQTTKNTAKLNKNSTAENKTSPLLYVAVASAAAVVGFLIMKFI